MAQETTDKVLHYTNFVAKINNEGTEKNKKFAHN